MKNKKIIVIGFLIGFLFLIFISLKLLIIRSVVIVGNKNLTETQIRHALGLKEGNSIIYPSSKTLYERLRKVSWIKDAIIRKDLNGTLTIQIKESIPVAIAMSEDKAYLIDYEAQILEDFTEKLKHSQIFLPTIKGIDPFKNRETLHAAVELLNFINSKNLAQSQDEIIITGSQPDNLTMNMNNIKIIVGNGDFETKFSKYAIVNSEIQKRGLNVQYVDLRFPDKVIVKPLE